ncbi:electron transfer flavoprotein subunit alpha/FixB family protein [Alteribacter natronophilus]|uniref:electron transfer flavoprotein subunit alpha/FixB family protein n=1 Tax=Alteribacter natronophilus TaxID=2583810 RepID=UPI00110D42E9|nr:electron transfer flavoprotein subunit alpha/FixB family protein [Alteribacter natronophilus]TMW71865.1 electron transfer flavoprotein subunit alpha/FixB family protein [Alteribacter natronophilus]
MRVNIDDYRGVWVFMEQKEGQLLDVGLELLAAGQDLARKLEVDVCGVLLGDGVKPLTNQIFEAGADKVYVIDDPILKFYRTETYMKAVGDLVRKYKPEIFLYGATSNGKDLASAVATDVLCGLTADTTLMDVNVEKRLFEASRPAFGGNIMATILCKKHRPQMATVRPKVIKRLPPEPGRTGEVVEEVITLKEEDLKTKVLEIVKSSKKAVNLEEADIIVAAGKGVKDAKGFAMVAELAEAMNATLGASRDVVEAGLCGHERQVGQTGATVTPKVYVAVGISGAIQHLVGMQNAELIVAINSDREAPIFQAAHYGIEADAFTVVPMLTEAFRKELSREPAGEETEETEGVTSRG